MVSTIPEISDDPVWSQTQDCCELQYLRISAFKHKMLLFDTFSLNETKKKQTNIERKSFYDSLIHKNKKF